MKTILKALALILAVGVMAPKEGFAQSAPSKAETRILDGNGNLNAHSVLFNCFSIVHRFMDSNDTPAFLANDITWELVTSASNVEMYSDANCTVPLAPEDKQITSGVSGFIFWVKIVGITHVGYDYSFRCNSYQVATPLPVSPNLVVNPQPSVLSASPAMCEANVPGSWRELSFGLQVKINGGFSPALSTSSGSSNNPALMRANP